MALKDLLVHVDSEPNGLQQVETALALAARFDSHLTSVHIAEDIQWPPGAYDAMTPELLQSYQSNQEEKMQSVKERVMAMAKEADRPVTHRMKSVPGAILPNQIALHARHADLTIMRQVEPEESRAGGRELPATIMLESGRPVLIVPYIGCRRQPGERVMVAWNATRESARALNDALPFLTTANEVVVVSVMGSSSRGDFGPDPGADIGLHLARHGVKTDVQRVEASDVDVGSMLLSHISDRDIDMLVMGGYGRSRFSEWIMGGVTHDIFTSMTVPVFMSH